MYAQLVGGSWDSVPEVVRRVHEPGKVVGTFRIVRGSGALASMIGWIARFPPAGERVPIVLQVEEMDNGLRWRRQLGKHLVVTEQEICGPLMYEASGPATCAFEVRGSARGIHYDQRSASLQLGKWRLPLPSFLAPRVVASCTCERDGLAFVSVEISAPLCGLVLSYAGDVAPEAEEDGGA